MRGWRAAAATARGGAAAAVREPGRAMLAALVVLAAARGAAAACGRPDAWCDGVPDCADGSDEPAGCSPCNRTYSGRAGDTYRLVLPRPARAPFLCHLTFAARGGAAGDVVQLALDDFRIGRYAGGARDACPDGHLALAELGRPYTGGSWCGQAAGAALYYSETPTVTATIRLARLRLGDPFAFHLRYKFIAQRDAVVRFGAGAALLERGAVSPGTYCTRTFDECHRKRCSLQSPNYPGMYPRNVSCYWSLRQKDIPTCKHAMIAIRQDHSHKMQIKRSISMARLNATRRGVWAWGACGGERDRLIFYDGATTDDPVLLEFCGGDWLPRVASRGPDMLVAFHSAPFSAPPPPLTPNHPLRGFELDVEVVFADSDSLDYVREARRCEFHVKASSPEEEWEPSNNETGAAGAGRGRRGVVRSPAHTLPPGAACSWTFHGRATDKLWFYFSSFTHYSLLAPANDSTERDDDVTPLPDDISTTSSTAGSMSECPVWVEVWEGAGGEERRTAAQCGAGGAGGAGGRVCARAALANATRTPRPCAPPDAYVSTAPLLSLRVATRAGTATHPLRFVLHYEFVDAALLGEPLPTHESEGYWPAECARAVSAEGAVWSARNALWFGGGGASSLRCVTRLAAGGARAAFTLTAASLGPRPACDTRPDPLSGRLQCVPHDALDPDQPLTVPHLLVYEMPWPGYRVPLACICDNSSAPLSLSSWGALEVELAAPRMSPAHTPHNTHYRGTWRRAAADCSHHAHTPHHVYLTHPAGGEEVECAESPWLLSASGNRSVVVRLWGVPLTDAAACKTTNRLLVYSSDGRLIRAICPGETGEQGPVEAVFSEAWHASGASTALLVVWLGREAGVARFSWMQVWRAPAAAAAAAAAALDAARNDTARCVHACVALGACMGDELWCDGSVDCPGGADEAAGCGAGARLLRGLRAGGAAAGLAAAAAALLLLLAVRCWRRRSAPHKARLPDELLSATSTLS